MLSSAQTELKYLKLNFIIYNLEIGLFSSGGGFRSSNPLTQTPKYSKVHKNFIPINYKMIGIDKINLNGTFDLYINIDPDYILEMWSKSGIPAL